MLNMPKGVTIHYLDESVDTGDIIVQKEIQFDLDHATLATSYEKLHSTIQELFKQHWNNIKNGSCQKQKQTAKGSSHRFKDKENLSHLLTDGWNTPVSILNEYAAEMQMYMHSWEQYDSEMVI